MLIVLCIMHLVCSSCHIWVNPLPQHVRPAHHVHVPAGQEAAWISGHGFCKEMRASSSNFQEASGIISASCYTLDSLVLHMQEPSQSCPKKSQKKMNLRSFDSS